MFIVLVVVHFLKFGRSAPLVSGLAREECRSTHGHGSLLSRSFQTALIKNYSLAQRSALPYARLPSLLGVTEP